MVAFLEALREPQSFPFLESLPSLRGWHGPLCRLPPLSNMAIKEVTKAEEKARDSKKGNARVLRDAKRK